LGSIVDIFSGVLSGANYGPWAPPFVSFLDPHPNPVGEGLGHFFGAMRIDGFRPADEFKNHMDQWIQRFRAAKRIDEAQPVLIPGDPERAMEAIRKKEGIPVLAPVVSDLRELSKKYDVAFD
jgi:LDH2 family malate/lactate/ureidoglycolate dehydrogenase